MDQDAPRMTVIQMLESASALITKTMERGESHDDETISDLIAAAYLCSHATTILMNGVGKAFTCESRR